MNDNADESPSKRFRNELHIPVIGSNGEPVVPQDQQLRVGVGVQQGKVIIMFGVPISFVMLDAKQARLIACKIIEASDTLPTC